MSQANGNYGSDTQSSLGKKVNPKFNGLELFNNFFGEQFLEEENNQMFAQKE